MQAKWWTSGTAPNQDNDWGVWTLIGSSCSSTTQVCLDSLHGGGGGGRLVMLIYYTGLS